jgi:phage shock protein C
MQNKLFRSRSDRMIAGVCGGLGQYLGVDSTIVRIIAVILALSPGPGLLIYILLAVIMPEEPEIIEESRRPVPLGDDPASTHSFFEEALSREPLRDEPVFEEPVREEPVVEPPLSEVDEIRRDGAQNAP